MMSNNNGRDEEMGEIHVSSDIEGADKKLAESIKGKIQPKPSRQPCIFKVSPILQQGKEDMFVPQVVSIGPFHRGKESLRRVEESKKWYLHASLSRNSANLEEWVKAIGEKEEEARECYAESINLTRNEFIEMMLLDGCFILEVLYSAANDKEMLENERWVLSRLGQDFLLLENQLPFFILDLLFDLTMASSEENCSLKELVINSFEDILPTLEQCPVDPSIDARHMLDLIRNILLPSSQKKDIVHSEKKWQYTYSAMDLRELGVDFKKKDKNGGILDITFNADKGVLEIPPFYLGKETICLLQNLIALEEYDPVCTIQIISYVKFLDILIDSPKDVRLLHKNKIMETFRDHEEVSHAINRLGKGLINQDFYYDGLYHRVNDYCRSNWHGWRANLMHNYFNTPWSIISVVAAFILLVLTLLQTVFSILS